MKKEQIRATVDELYEVIREAKEELERIRSLCLHETTHVMEYAWGDLAHTCPAHICTVCDHCVSTIFDDNFEVATNGLELSNS